MDKIEEQLTRLWSYVTDLWDMQVWGVDIGESAGAILIFLGFLVLRGIFTNIVINRLCALTKRTETDLDDAVINALREPVRFIPIILGVFFAAEALTLTEGTMAMVEQLIRSLIVFTIFWGLFRIFKPLSLGLKPLERALTPTMVQWIFKAARFFTVLVGAAIILEIWGIKIGPILAGLGLFGAAVALGAQDMFKNLIAGLTIIAEKKFQPGDWIKVDGVTEGTVENVSIRSTTVRRFDKAPMQVPNAQLSDAAVINFSAMTHRRIYWMIGVEYKTSVDQLKIIRDEILDYLAQGDEFAPPQEATQFVRIDSFNASSIDIMLYCFTRTTDWGNWLEIKERLAFKVKEIVEEKAGTGFAFPSQTLYVEAASVGDAPEPFEPPQKGK